MVSAIAPPLSFIRSVPHPCQNRRKTAVTSGQPRAPRTASDLHMGRVTRCVKRPFKQLVSAELGTERNHEAYS
jgi:hypothetical protein